MRERTVVPSRVAPAALIGLLLLAPVRAAASTSSAQGTLDAARSAEVLEEVRGSFVPPKLQVGMQAPPLSVEGWVKGEGVGAFEPDRVYVLEFWATWCAPCIRSMPHLSDLQDQLEGRVEIVGVNLREVDPSTGEPLGGERRREAVARFLAARGIGVRYDVALGARAMEADWMSASGRSSLPTAIIVDGAGRVAWVGGAVLEMEAALERVLSGEHDLAQAREAQLTQARVQHLSRTINDAAVNGDLPRFFELANALSYVAEHHEAEYLASLVDTVLTHPLLEGKRELDFALRGAELACALTNRSLAEPLRVAAHASFATGHLADAVERAEQALALADAASPLATRIRDELKGYASAYAEADAPRIERIDEKIPLRMQQLNVPGLSVAVIESFRVAWAKGYGVRVAGGEDRVTSRTLFQAASISKPIAVTAALVCVERGLLGLDEDVDTYLESWHVPDSELTRTQKVTLRRLATHTAGFNVAGVLGLAPDEPFPTLAAVLDGVSVREPRPQPPSPVAERLRLETVPGSEYSYSGGGIMVVQQLLVDLLDRPFDELARELVLDPLGMSDSTFRQPPRDEMLARCAFGHRANGTLVDGRYRVYPGAAAAGLWTTPSDLARFAIETMLAAEGRASTVLGPALTRERLRPSNGPSGMGLFLGEENGTRNFNHGGSNAGYKCYMVALPDAGKASC